jgi:Probable cobalt transporter subunit (CbtB)
MSTPADSTAPAPTASVDRVPTWLLLTALAVAAAIVWLVAFDNGQASAMADSTHTFLHEFFHDARHASGAPCH